MFRCESNRRQINTRQVPDEPGPLAIRDFLCRTFDFGACFAGRSSQSCFGCKACDLWKRGTQTVFGEGKSSAAVMMVGEQPGDQEDRAGRPFVGPAGRILDQALEEAGIDRAEVYVTNVVKHFKWSPAERGKRRIHKKPRDSEIHACRPWLDAELDAVRPKVLVCLGASAAQALLGKDFRVTRDRGKLIPSDLAPNVIATVHPSSILRAGATNPGNLNLSLSSTT